MKKSKIIRAIYIVVGCISLVLGAIGVILPILPINVIALSFLQKDVNKILKG